MTAGRCARTIRAAVFAAVCVVLAALGHVMMSGDHVPLRTLLAGWAVTGVAGWCLAGRERGLRLVVAVAVAVQTALHSAFSLAPADGSSTGAHSLRGDSMDMGTSGAGSLGHGMGSTESMPKPMSAHLGHAGHTPDGDSSLGMLAAHLLAALLCGLWLGHGERAVFRLLRAVGGRLAAPLRLLFALPAPPPAPVRVRRRSSDRAPRLLLLVHAVTSRGPPVRAAAV
ncbi:MULTISPECIES: hypothetical protein [Streptomyces]|uniref:Integral membrane protein n=1 Tax=Streptomyces chartreusis NRRL 3882 TaxID=1079985 RepID=A0A2N9BKN8_STRCX|nr:MULTISPECIES: hypothetical protein [Streptomyces]MYS94678.1 hypothetical protein [Streptomyces sp. SID5464]SOR83926.1 hypothetical protein SCNRRL3882_7372 [Streptomyces chartreusis NRRL 3882]